MRKYIAYSDMRKHLKKIKNINEHARVIGLDIGRKYTGISISYKFIQQAKPYRTLINDP